MLDTSEPQLTHTPSVMTKQHKLLHHLIPPFEAIPPMWQLRVGGGSPTVLIIGVEGADWETLALQTTPSFWRMIEKRRSDKTISLDSMRKWADAQDK